MELKQSLDEQQLKLHTQTPVLQTLHKHRKWGTVALFHPSLPLILKWPLRHEESTDCFQERELLNSSLSLIASNERVTFLATKPLVTALCMCVCVRKCIMVRCKAQHKVVTRCFEAKKLLSCRRQSDYSMWYSLDLIWSWNRVVYVKTQSDRQTWESAVTLL